MLPCAVGPRAFACGYREKSMSRNRPRRPGPGDPPLATLAQLCLAWRRRTRPLLHPLAKFADAEPPARTQMILPFASRDAGAGLSAAEALVRSTSHRHTDAQRTCSRSSLKASRSALFCARRSFTSSAGRESSLPALCARIARCSAKGDHRQGHPHHRSGPHSPMAHARRAQRQARTCDRRALTLPPRRGPR